jgi:hypothetical protein
VVEHRSGDGGGVDAWMLEILKDNKILAHSAVSPIMIYSQELSVSVHQRLATFL